MPELVKQMIAAGCELSRKLKGSISVVVRCPGAVLRLSGFAKMVMDSINAARVNPKSLVLEFPGDLLCTSAKELDKLFSELGRWGVECAVRYANATPLQIGALSGGLVKHLVLTDEMMESVPAQESRRAVVQSMLDMSYRLGIPSLVHGVTDASQGHFLSLHQAQWICGDFISPPLDLAGFVGRRRTTWKFR